MTGPKEKAIDHVARWTAIASVVASLVGIAIQSCISQNALAEQRKQFEIQQSEQLSIQLDPQARGFFQVTNSNYGSMGYVVQFPWGLLLSNTGNQKLSITTIEIRNGIPPNQMSYTDIYGGILTGSSEKVQMPIVLEPGESKRLFIYVGIPVPKNVFEVFLDIAKRGVPDTGIARKELALDKGLDFFGNAVSVKRYETGEFSMAYDLKKSNFPQFGYLQRRGDYLNFLHMQHLMFSVTTPDRAFDPER